MPDFYPPSISGCPTESGYYWLLVSRRKLWDRASELVNEIMVVNFTLFDVDDDEGHQGVFVVTGYEGQYFVRNGVEPTGDYCAVISHIPLPIPASMLASATSS